MRKSLHCHDLAVSCIKSLKLSEPQFNDLYNGVNKAPFQDRFEDSNEMVASERTL